MSISSCFFGVMPPFLKEKKKIDSSHMTPIVTCPPWNPVNVKNVVPNRFVLGVSPVSTAT